MMNPLLIRELLNDNPLLRGVLAGAAAATAIAGTTAFGPVGVVGVLGWKLVYAVAATTTAYEIVRSHERRANRVR